MNGEGLPVTCDYPSTRVLPLSLAVVWLSAGMTVSTQPATIELVATLDVPAHLVELHGARAYVAADDTFRVIDLSDPTQPSEIGTLTAPGRIWGLHVAEPYVYLAGGLEGLHIVDVTDPTVPTLLATHPTAGQALGVTTSGTTAMVVNLMTGLEIVDISDRTTPTLLSTHETPGYQWGIGRRGSNVFVVDQPSGLHLFDVSDPTTPVPVSVHTTDQPAQAVVLDQGHRAYLISPRGGLVEIVNVEDPRAPRLAGSYQPSGRFQRVAVDGFDLVVPVGDAGVEIVDVSEPSTPTRIASYDTPGQARDAAISDGLIAVADSDSLLILSTR